MFPPGAVVFDVPVSISLEDHTKYYGLIVQNNLQNDVRFGAPVIRQKDTLRTIGRTYSHHTLRIKRS